VHGEAKGLLDRNGSHSEQSPPGGGNEICSIDDIYIATPGG
jgi:hypothetical protein